METVSPGLSRWVLLLPSTPLSPTLRAGSVSHGRLRRAAAAPRAPTGSASGPLPSPHPSALLFDLKPLL